MKTISKTYNKEDFDLINKKHYSLIFNQICEEKGIIKEQIKEYYFQHNQKMNEVDVIIVYSSIEEKRKELITKLDTIIKRNSKMIEEHKKTNEQAKKVLESLFED